MRAMVTSSMISVLSVIALASEDVDVSDAISLLQVRATHHSSAQECSIEVETSDRNYGDTSTGASVRLQVDGIWTLGASFPNSISGGEEVTATQSVSARPTALKITAGGTNAWGYSRISVSCGEETVMFLEGDEAYSGDTRFWVDGNDEAPEEQEYEIPATNPIKCVIEAETSSRNDGGTVTGARAQLQADGKYTLPRNFPLNIAQGEIVSTTAIVASRPSTLKIAAGGSNAWGYKRLSVTCDGESVFGLEGDEDYSANTLFWVDGDQEAPETQEYQIPALEVVAPEVVAPEVVAPVEDTASAVGDPHMITSSAHQYDLEKHHLHRLHRQ